MSNTGKGKYIFSEIALVSLFSKKKNKYLEQRNKNREKKNLVVWFL